MPGEALLEEKLLGILLIQPDLYKFVSSTLDESLFFTEFGKKVFSAFKPNFESGTEPIISSAPLSPEEISAVAKLIALRQKQNDNTKDTVIKITDALKAKKAKSDADVIPGSEVEFPLSGSQYGQITCEAIGLDAPVYWYDTDDILAYGVGQSLISLLPGFGRVIVLSGHNTTYFACLQSAEVGNVIQFHTNYCDYEYTVTNVQVYNENDLEKLLIQKAVQC
jgi:LPXTG-site transpeptidase (sortase) family protein